MKKILTAFLICIFFLTGNYSGAYTPDGKYTTTGDRQKTDGSVVTNVNNNEMQAITGTNPSDVANMTSDELAAWAELIKAQTGKEVVINNVGTGNVTATGDTIQSAYNDRGEIEAGGKTVETGIAGATNKTVTQIEGTDIYIALYDVPNSSSTTPPGNIPPGWTPPSGYVPQSGTPQTSCQHTTIKHECLAVDKTENQERGLSGISNGITKTSSNVDLANPQGERFTQYYEYNTPTEISNGETGVSGNDAETPILQGERFTQYYEYKATTEISNGETGVSGNDAETPILQGERFTQYYEYQATTEISKQNGSVDNQSLGNKALSDEKINFDVSLEPSVQAIKQNPLTPGSSFTISGHKHITRNGSNPNMETKTKECGEYDTIDCSLDIPGHEGINTGAPCTKIVSYTDYGEPVYEDYYNGVKVEFSGFRVNKVGKSDIIVSNSQKKSESTRPELKNDTYSKGYTVVELVASELKSAGNTGLVKGSVKVSCLCGKCAPKTFDIYFNIIPEISEERLEAFNLTIKADGNGKIGFTDGTFSESLSTKAAVDTSINITAKADEGYEFDAWYEANEAYFNGRDDWYETANVYRDISDCAVTMKGHDFTLIARFVPIIPKTYKIHIYSDGNGVVQADGKQGKELCISVEEGKSINLSAIAFEDSEHKYKFLRWDEIYNGTQKEYGYSNPITITPNRDYTIIAYFGKVSGITYKLTLDVEDPNTGYVIPYGVIDAIPGREYNIYAFPFDNYNFYGWRDGNGKMTKLGQFDSIIMLEEDYKLSAVFNNFTSYQLSVESGDGGKVAIEPNENFKLQDTITTRTSEHIIKAKANEGFRFAYWECTKTGEKIYKERCTEKDGIYSYTIKVDDNLVYIAHFEYAGDKATYKLTVNSQNGGKVEGTVENAVPGEFYRICATSNNNYKFSFWKDDEGNILSAKEIIWVQMKDREYTVTAYFDKQGGGSNNQKYNLTIKTEGNGTVTGSGSYSWGEDVAIKATPKNGYRFYGWYEDNGLLSIQKDYTIYMYGNRNLTAKFVKDTEDYVSAFKVISIRDLRWQDYFVNTGEYLNNYLTVPKTAGKNTVLVNSATLINNDYNSGDRSVVYGYAVECELEISSIGCDVEDLTLDTNPELIIEAKVTDERGNDIPLDEKFREISSKDDEAIESFMISAIKNHTEVDINGEKIENPNLKWRWVYYLPLDLDYDDADELIVEFGIKLKLNESTSYDYIEAIKLTDKNNWDGKVFTYRTDKTLLDDIYNNAVN